MITGLFCIRSGPLSEAATEFHRCVERSVSVCRRGRFMSTAEFSITRSRCSLSSSSSGILFRGFSLADSEEQTEVVPQGPKPVPFEFKITAVTQLPVIERDYIQYVLDRNGGNKMRTARELGIDRRTLYRKLKKQIDHKPE